MFKNISFNHIAILCACISCVCLLYNFKLGYNNRYNAGGDALDYISLGTVLAKTGYYGKAEDSDDHILNDFQNGNVENKSYKFKKHSTWRPPLWPGLIAFVFLIFGYKLLYILIFKVVIHLIGVGLFYKILRLLEYDKWYILIGAFIYSVSPVYQIYGRVFLVEPLTLFIITVFLYYLLKCQKNTRGFALLGLTGALVILSHPYYIFLPFTIYLMLVLSKQIQTKHFIISSVISLFIVALWPIRNAIVLKTNSLIMTTSSGAVMAKGWNKEVPQLHTNTQGDLADEGLVLKEGEEVNVQNEIDASKQYSHSVVQFIKENKKLIVPIILTKLKSAFNPLAETPKPGILETGRVSFHILALLASIFLLFRGADLVRALNISLILSTVLIAIITYSGFRFRSPQFVLELLFIVECLNNLKKEINRRYLSITY